ENTTAALGAHEEAVAVAAALAQESSAKRAQFDAERTRLLNELEVARTDIENARAEIEVLHGQLAILKSDAADERAAFSAGRAEEDRVVAELETARAHAPAPPAKAAPP